MHKDIQFSTLPSGLRVATDRVDHVETTALGLWVNAGSRCEPPEANGTAHLLEHMVFKGTERRDARAIAEEMEAVGGMLNAYTDREVTGFDAKLLKDDFALGLDIIADMVQHPRFDAAELERERHVVLQEIGQAHDTPDDIIFDHFQETAYARQPLGAPILGKAETVRSLPRHALSDFRTAHYGPENLVFTACGPVDHDRVAAAVAQAFSDLPASTQRVAPRARYPGGEFRSDQPLEQTHIVLGFERPGLHDPDHYAIRLLAMLLGGGMASRLFQEVREQRGLVYTVEAVEHAYADTGLFLVYAGTAAERAGEYMTVLCDALNRMRGEAVSAQELRRVKTQVKAALLMREENTAARSDLLGQQILRLGRPVHPDEIVAEIEAVGADDLRRVAGRLFAGAPTLATVGPAAQVPSVDSLAQRLGAAQPESFDRAAARRDLAAG